jgi:hypothetical protein
MLSEGSGCGGLGVRLRLPLLVLLVRWICRRVRREKKNAAKNQTKSKQRRIQKKTQRVPPLPIPSMTNATVAPANRPLRFADPRLRINNPMRHAHDSTDSRFAEGDTIRSSQPEDHQAYDEDGDPLDDGFGEIEGYGDMSPTT